MVRIHQASFGGVFDAQPSPSEDLFHLITQQHAIHSDGRTNIAHDVATGPGNSALRLLRDVNTDAMEAAPGLVSQEHANRLTFVKSATEKLGSAVVETTGNTDVVVVSRMPLLDPVRSLDTFHALLRPKVQMSPGFAFERREAEALAGSLDCIAIPVDKWTNVRQIKVQARGSTGQDVNVVQLAPSRS
ncbi:hypothetical protein PspLS_09752 [Pyricularia sp. CBS 133598]|nr:hypothetical protein PspLS_09752 [Pyricularia sp. CBS 133598]